MSCAAIFISLLFASVIVAGLELLLYASCKVVVAPEVQLPKPSVPALSLALIQSPELPGFCGKVRVHELVGFAPAEATVNVLLPTSLYNLIKPRAEPEMPSDSVAVVVP